MAGPVTLAQWFARRAGGAVIVWLLISFLAFSLSTLAPGDPAQLMLLRRTGDAPSEAEVVELRHRLGLDRPFAQRYATWLSRTSRGDFGESYRTGQPVLTEPRTRFPATLTLAVTALLVGLLIAVPLAAVSAAARGTFLDHAARLVTLVGVSMPSYWLAYMLMLVFMTYNIVLCLGVIIGTGMIGARAHCTSTRRFRHRARDLRPLVLAHHVTCAHACHGPLSLMDTISRLELTHHLPLLSAILCSIFPPSL